MYFLHKACSITWLFYRVFKKTILRLHALGHGHVYLYKDICKTQDYEINMSCAVIFATHRLITVDLTPYRTFGKAFGLLLLCLKSMDRLFYSNDNFRTWRIHSPHPSTTHTQTRFSSSGRWGLQCHHSRSQKEMFKVLLLCGYCEQGVQYPGKWPD